MTDSDPILFFLIGLVIIGQIIYNLFAYKKISDLETLILGYGTRLKSYLDEKSEKLSMLEAEVKGIRDQIKYQERKTDELDTKIQQFKAKDNKE